ncbi:MAG: T9SS type A sorting domain-containing protein, partial [Rufibacter sp.]
LTNLEKLPQGAYILKMTSGSQTLTQKLIKN